MEPYPFHYSHRSKADDSVPVDLNFRLMFEELQRMEACLSEKIEGHCGGLETRVLEVE
jgi:hypothetical protein